MTRVLQPLSWLLASALLLVAGDAAARPRTDCGQAPETWSLVASAGLEALPDSAGRTYSVLGLFGLAGTVRLSRGACVDVRFGAGATDDGSETTRVSETRLRLDLRPAFCPAVLRAVTFVLAAGPAAALSLHEARVRDGRIAYSAFDVGIMADAGVLFRIGPVALRIDADAGVLRRFTFGFFLAAGVAL